ncbi:YadA family autotransporter adhesin [Haemophilus sp. 27098_8_127]|jgi:hypothetical protein|uniref:YadA family autotransporter adhesin n=1 Tax=Haemophilus sp. 27098_8_127 TaxID=3003684 RepID=UPI00352EB846
MKKSLLALTVLSVCSAAQAIGPTLQYNDEVAVGENVTMTGLGNVYIGRDTGNNLGLQNATTVGQLSYAGGNQAVAVGSEANANATNSVAVGANTFSAKDNSVAVGYKAATVGDSAIAIGRESNATHDNSVAIGAGSVSKKEVSVNQATIGTVTYVGFAGNNPVATFSVGAKDKERQIVNVAAGEISATSTDAINGSQLYTIAQAVEDLATNPPRMCLTMSSSDNNVNIEQIDEGTFDFTLNKDLANLNSVTTSADNGDTTTVTTDGMNIRHYDSPNGMEYNTSYNHNGLTIKRNDGDANPIDEISLTTDGLNNGGKRIINVKEGSKGTDAVNVNQLNKVREENQQITEKVTRNGDKITQLEKDVVKNTTKITENTKAIEANTDYIKAIEKKLPVVEAGKNTTVTTSTDANGKITYTVSSKDFQPEINKVDDKANKNATDIGDLTKRIVTNEGNITNNSNRISTLEKQIPEVDAGTNVEVTTTDVNGKKTFTVSTKKDVGFDKVTVGDVVVDKNGINAGNQTIINVKDGVNDTDAVNVNQLKSVDNKVNQNAQGIAENKQAIASIDKRHSVVEQGKNTKVTSRKGSNGETIYTVSTADDLTVKSVTFVDGPVINNNGINANNTKVTNVKEGTADTDAVNVAQLNRVKSAVNGNTAKINKLNTRVDGLDRDVRKNRKRADAGTASVAAMANIPQVYLPGKSGVGVGVGYKHGQSAIAVGYSKASDNSKHIVKLSVGADSQKDVTLGAGYMYQW